MQTVPTITRVESPQQPGNEIPEAITDTIQQALRGLQFGEITITVRNGAVTQIERVVRSRQFKSRPND